MAESTPSHETLIDYHFGTLAAEAAARVEERLLAEPELLRAYLQLKRQLDASALVEAPSPRARARLREAVAAAYGPGAGRSLRRWLGRPVPLYQTLAVAAAVGVVVALAGLGIRPGPGPIDGLAPPGATGEPGPVVDSARVRPGSLEVF
jgi:anti-sigma-K factor RskA